MFLSECHRDCIRRRLDWIGGEKLAIEGGNERLSEMTMVIDHGINGSMKEVAISVFKAKCLGILEEVRKTRRPIRVTRFGKPVAEVVPPSPVKGKKRRLGSMVGTGEILGDIVGPTGSWEDWESAR